MGRLWRGKRVLCVLPLAIIVAMTLANTSSAQGRGRAAGGAQTARSVAPTDLTGYWVSVVTEHWHLRMMVPPKGDFSMLPVNAEARRLANAWDPAKDAASGEQCKSYGAAAIMRVPGRLHIHWADDNTLQVDTDSGTQTRLFHFGGAGPVTDAPQWQGYSVAMWDGQDDRGRGGPIGGAGVAGGTGHLKVITTRMRPGYLRKNGVPYSDKAVLEEHFDRFTEPNGDTWLLVTSIVTDPQYLTQPYATTVQFKQIADQAGWDPTPCRANEPR